MIRSQLTRHRLVALAALSLGAGAAVAQTAGGSRTPARAATAATAPAMALAAGAPGRGVAQPAPAAPGLTQPVPVTPGAGLPPFALPARVFPARPCASRRRWSTVGVPPSKALLDAFAILRRDRTPEDELPAGAWNALRVRGLTPVTADAARLLRSAGAARAWVVRVPDVDRSDPFACRRGGASPREGVAVVALGGAPAGGGGALLDLARGIAPVAVDSCAGERRDMLGVSGIVPDGVPAVFLTAPDGSAVRADVQDNGFSFVVSRGRTFEPRHVVWTGSDGTPHVQPVSVFFGGGRVACERPIQLSVVTPTGTWGCGPFTMIFPLAPGQRATQVLVPQAPHAIPGPPVVTVPRKGRKQRRRPRAASFVTQPCAIGILPRLFPPAPVQPGVVVPAPAGPRPLPLGPPRKRTP